MTVRDVLARTAALAGGWMLLTGGNPSSWIVGVPTVLAAVAVSATLTPAVSWRWRWSGALGFALFFLWHSARGGVDVAWRALHPRLPVRPGLVRVRLRLPPGPARRWLAIVLSLQPGTVSVALEADDLLVHTIDERLPVIEDVAAVEARVAAMFGMTLDAPARRPA